MLNLLLILVALAVLSCIVMGIINFFMRYWWLILLIVFVVGTWWLWHIGRAVGQFLGSLI